MRQLNRAAMPVPAPASTLADTFARDGYCCTPGPLLPAPAVARAVAGMDAVRAGHYDTGVAPQPSPWNPGDSPSVLCKIEMPQAANHAIRALLTQPELGAFVAKATGAEAVQVWWVQLLYKPPATTPDAPTSVGWHQDFQYWRDNWHSPEGLLTAWIALSDVGADAGPVRFVPGSHRWGFLGEGDFFGQDTDAVREGIHVPAGETWREEAALLPPGGASLHHSLTYHGSSPNRSALPRRSFAVHLRTERAVPRGGRHGLTAFLDDPTRCPVIYGKADRLD